MFNDNHAIYATSPGSFDTRYRDEPTTNDHLFDADSGFGVVNGDNALMVYSNSTHTTNQH